jgi:hypothetical protein
VVLEPRERYVKVRALRLHEHTRDDQRTFIEAVRDDKAALRMPHFRVFLILAELVDALLGKLHN